MIKHKKEILICLIFLCIKNQAQVNPTKDQPATGTVTPVTIDPAAAAPRDHTEVDETPELIRKQFNADYPGKSLVTWSVGKKDYRVSYTDPRTNTGHVIFYDKAGKIIRREDEVPTAQYPQAIGDFYSKKFPGEKYKVWVTENMQGQKFYYIPRERRAFWFDATGKFIEKKKTKTGK